MAQTTKFCVSGTTCHSCEVLLERELKSVPGIIGVKASHASGCVEVTIARDAALTPEDLNRHMSTSKYRFTAWQEGTTSSSWNWQRIGGMALIVFALWYLFDRFGILSVSPSLNGSVGLLSIFFIGIVASLSSCTAILAGFILALSSSHAKRHASESAHDRLRPHILFNLGRLIGFAGFGALVGYLGSLLVLSPGLNAFFVIVVAMLMLGIGANLLGLVPKGAFLIAPPKWLTHQIHNLQDSKHPAVPFVLGALTFFLPCGFTQSVQLYALSTGDPITAAIVMAVFALGTAPVLFGLGAATSVAHGKTLKRVTQVAGILVLVIALSQLRNGAALLGISAPGAVSQEKLAVAEDSVILADGKQIIQMELASGFYSPDVLQVVEDIPVEWQIYAPQFMGCADTLVSRGLGISTRLKPGDNTIAFTPKEPGKYIFSCSMGMVRGTMVVVPNKN
ncbi:MAG: sulfite exporter TauE/SafE family protein [Candidatus Uhrbacteria bacterium]|nr:sulfite exporter TauE/SafE family protein [Candidatus Uhrbacteria bacterium]